MIEDSSNNKFLNFSVTAQIRSINGRKNKQDDSLKGQGPKPLPLGFVINQHHLNPGTTAKSDQIWLRISPDI
jgi:hypothetical protein